jgi:FAD/FMN-containing dehydrogenase
MHPPAPPWIHAPRVLSRELFATSRLTDTDRKSGVVTDASGVVRAKPQRVLAPRSIEDVQTALATARSQQLRVSVAGTRHSGGGQSLVDNTLLLDMLQMDGVRYDSATGLVHAQPGATWEQVQQVLAPHGRAVATQQSSNVFSVGGSIATNIHGRDIRFGPIIDDVASVDVVLPSGEIKHATPTSNADLLAHTVGGYGQTGVVVEAALRTVPDEVMDYSASRMPVSELPAFLDRLKRDPNARMLQVRLPVHKNGMFDTVHAIEYRAVPGRQPQPAQPKPAGRVSSAVMRGVFRSAIHSDAGKRALWELQTRVEPKLQRSDTTRNRVMAPSVEFLRSNSQSHRQVLQEYFIPVDRTKAWLDDLEATVKSTNANLLNVTLRYTPAEITPSALPYATADSIAAVLYLDQRPGEPAQAAMDAFTGAATDAAIRHGGRPYLPYQLGAFTPEQLDAAYPDRGQFFETVKRWDPENVMAGGIERIAPPQKIS